MRCACRILCGWNGDFGAVGARGAAGVGGAVGAEGVRSAGGRVAARSRAGDCCGRNGVDDEVSSAWRRGDGGSGVLISSGTWSYRTFILAIMWWFGRKLEEREDGRDGDVLLRNLYCLVCADLGP
jgi:hypothetical protein